MNGGPSPAIRAIGLAVPRFAYRQSDLVSFMTEAHGLDEDASRRLYNLYARSRIGTRHSCLEDFGRSWPEFTFFPPHPRLEPPLSTSSRMAAYREHAPALARRACEDLFRNPHAGRPESVDHIFVVSCTGFFAPGIDVLLARSLGLRADVGRTLIGFQGCQGGLTALRLADNLCRARPAATALVVCVELCTIHLQNDPTEENLLANALFADGAAAVLVCGAESARVSPVEILIHETATLLCPDTEDDMVWSVSDAGFVLKLSALIPRLLAAEVPRRVAEVFRVPLESMCKTRFWAVHPGGAAILDGLERALELPGRSFAVSREVLRRYGNMSSPTIFFVLSELLANSASNGPGIALAFGPGLTIEAARFEVVRSASGELAAAETAAAEIAAAEIGGVEIPVAEVASAELVSVNRGQVRPGRRDDS